MLTIRLQRVGKKKQPTYRFIVSEKTKDPWGDSLEILGHMNPRTNPASVVLKEDRVKHWIEKGAQMSDTVRNLFIDKGFVKGEKKRIVKMSRKKQAVVADAKAKAIEDAAKKKEAEEKKAAEAAAAPAPEAAPTEASADAEPAPAADEPAA